VNKPCYPNYLSNSGWNALLPLRQAKPSLRQDSQVDVAIIGAGYTGIAAAKRWHQLAAEDSIAIIDSSEVGEGNPGRNSGFLLEIALAEDADPHQVQRMARSNKLIADTLSAIVAEVKASGLRVDLQRTGTYRAVASDVGARSLSNYRAFLEAADLPFEILDREALNQRLGTRFYQQGLFSPHCYLAQPAALIRALAQQLPAAVQLYENTAALTLRREANRWCIETPEAVLRANKVILANNAFAKELGIGRSRLAAMYTYAGITPVLDVSGQQALGSDSSWGLLPTHRLGSTLRYTADNRLLVRSVHSYEKEFDPAWVRASLTKKMRSRFPQLQKAEFEYVWGGAVGFTYNGGALWGEARSGLYVSSGCNGGGTVKGTLLGGLLADLALGQKVPDVTSLFGSASWMPPDPVRAIGFHIRSSIEQFTGRREI